MVSSNNVEITRTRPDLPFLVETIPHCFWFRREDRQMPAVVYYQKICTIHKKTHVLKSFLNKTADHKAWNFIKKRLQHRCFPANTRKFLNNLFIRTSVYACFCRDFTKWLIKAFFLDRRFQNHLALAVLQ